MYQVSRAEKIFGEISLSGSKNAALPIIVGACMCDEYVELHNIPLQLNDVRVLVSLLKGNGFNIREEGADTLIIDNENNGVLSHEVTTEGGKIRYSLLLLSLLLHKCKSVKVPSPGGCNIGDRKYDIHIDSLIKMGAEIEENGYINGFLNGRFKGSDMTFHTATTSGSENVIIAGVLAEGKTIIRNANTRPEVMDLINFFNKMGGDIRYKTRYIEISGVERLKGGEYSVLSGRDEAVTYMILTGMCRGELRIKRFTCEKIKTDVTLLREIGLEIFEWSGDSFISAKNKQLRPFSMATAPYPGINSDMQPLFAALAATIEGETIITDMRFMDRFQYVQEYKKFGMSIENYSNCAIITGGKPIKGAKVSATDLRGGAALLLLGCVAEGVTEIENEYQIERGYINVIPKLNNLGCKIQKT